jgi:ubiquinone biosynthesis protein UbiJ
MNLPHRSVPIVSIKGKSERDAVMKLNENIAALKKQLDALESRVKKVGG